MGQAELQCLRVAALVRPRPEQVDSPLRYELPLTSFHSFFPHMRQSRI